jgi:3alpha(or 20beta)-hydroxysteroid dehydrogenase
VARFDGRVVLVTGAVRGMGASQVAAFVAEGARVVATDDTEIPGYTEGARHGEAARYMRLDVTSADDWAQAVTATEAVFGPIDVLVNNARIGCTGGILDQTTDDFQRVMAVNVPGTFLGMRRRARDVRPPTRRRGEHLVHLGPHWPTRWRRLLHQQVGFTRHDQDRGA